MGFGGLSLLPNCSATGCWDQPRCGEELRCNLLKMKRTGSNIFSLRHRFPDFGSLGIG